MFGGGQEFREGDRAWAGATILELPDLSSIHLEARLDESDRGRLKVGQDAPRSGSKRCPGKDFTARVDLISVLARVDFSSGWPPPRNFDLGLVLVEIDPRIRPGMTAIARIATDRVPNVMLVPVGSDLPEGRPPIVYKLNGSEVRRACRSRSRGAATSRRSSASGVEPGDRLAMRRPAPR